MNQLPIDFDICSRKHQGNPESVAAFDMGDKQRDKELVYTLLKIGPMTSKELVAATGKPIHSICPRCSELMAEGRIERTGQRRDGAAELRVK